MATARRVSEIHALSIDPGHLRFNQSDGSVSLRTEPGFLAKNQLPLVFPPAPKKGMVKFPGKGHFKCVTTG